MLAFISAVSLCASSWTVSTIGGSGPDRIARVQPCSVNASNHADGPAASSRFAAPTRAAALDGVVFALDGMNGCIRTIANGTVGSATPCCTDAIATGANGNGPQDMHVTAAHYYLLDSYHNQLKRAPRPFPAPPAGATAAAAAAWTAAAWTVLAGNGSRPHRGQSVDGDALGNALNEPHGMAVTSDGSGDVYIAETWSSCVRLLRGGRLTTVAGKCGFGGHADGAPLGEARFQHVHHINLDPRNESELYVSDAECWDDDRFPDDQKYRPCHATAGGACFSGIRKIELDRSSGLALRVSTVAGKLTTPNKAHPHKDSKRCNDWRDGNASVAMFDFIHGTAFQPLSDDERRRRDAAGAVGATGGAGAAAPLSGSDQIFVCDEDSNRIRAIDLATYEMTTVAGTGKAGHEDGEGAKATFRYPGGVGLDVDGNLYVGDYESSRIRKITFA
jgi:DNA-binding beta-propeller fold protein YncE